MSAADDAGFGEEVFLGFGMPSRVDSRRSSSLESAFSLSENLEPDGGFGGRGSGSSRKLRSLALEESPAGGEDSACWQAVE